MKVLTPLLFQHELAPDHPLRAARWIWPEGYLDLHNHFAHFRKDFDLARVPKPAPLYITADKGYRLYVNGRYVCRGPARGYQHSWPFDEVDLHPYLRQGHNWIAVEAYNPGVSTFQYVHQTAAGFLCAARWGDVTIISDLSWKRRRAPGLRVDTARLSMQLDFQEHADAAATDRGWITADAPPPWPDPHACSNMMNGSPFGFLPFLGVEPRGIPLLREDVVTPQRVLFHTRGTCDEGYRAWRNVSWPWLAEARRIADWRSEGDLPGRVTGDMLEVDVAPVGEGEFRSITIDFGDYIVGTLNVEADGGAGGELLDFHFAEQLTGDRPALCGPNRNCELALACRLRLAEGHSGHPFFHVMGFRYVTVVARDLSQPLRLRLSARTAVYPFTMRGVFECSAPLLNDIHAACRRTQQICSLDAYVDTPYREQAQWWGDARVQMANTFHLDGDARLGERGIRSIGGQPGPFGLTYGHTPTTAHNCVLPDFSLTWILTLWDHYWQTGQTTLIRELWPRVQQVLGYFADPYVRADNGLLRRDERFWYFGDWAGIFKGHTPTLLNLYYLLALDRLAATLDAADMRDEAAPIRAEFATHRERVLKHLYDADAQHFVGGLDRDGKPEGPHSLHDQTLAIHLGLAPEAHDAMIQRLLLPLLRGEKVEHTAPSAFWVTYVLGEMGRRGHAREVIDYIRRNWADMAAMGTTWEWFGRDENSGTVSHAWTAHPSFHLVNTLAGLRQAGVAWEAVSVKPCFHPDIDHVRAMVPSPRGDIAVHWRREGDAVAVEVDAPKDITVRIDIPGHEAEHRGPWRGVVRDTGA